MVDTHAHLYASEFDADRAATLARAFESGLTQVWMPNLDHTSVAGMLALEAQYPRQCLPMMGLHPCYVKPDFETELGRVEAWLGGRRFVAVGEIGLDFYWDTTYRAEQEEAFRRQVHWAHRLGLPIVIHCRNSLAETLVLLQKWALPDLRGIFHCFTGSLNEARQAIELGFLLGIGGVVTFKNGGLDKVVPAVDLRHLVLETDSPYLAPVPHRGKRNESGYLPLIAQRIADLLGTSREEVANATTQNARRLVGDAW
ncbi:MAG: TatD family hydrolase [Ferruginibacter sp.]|nr:TatD family hydrolase [Cytophagales bacterium]